MLLIDAPTTVPHRRAVTAALATMRSVGAEPERLIQRRNELPAAFLPQRGGTFLVPTCCASPLVTAEAVEVAHSSGYHGLVVRLDKSRGAPNPVSYDVLINSGDRVDVAADLVPYMDASTLALWLVPMIGDGECFHLNSDGLRRADGPPFSNRDQRRAGIGRAAAAFRCVLGEI